jgi:ribonucleoside-diphosphate reductase alpha chain
VIFLDRVNADNPTPELGRLESTNPCGELPLLPYESCNLGSLNLGRFVDAEARAIDWPALGAATRWGARLLDDVIETTTFPLPEVAEATRRSRKIGLGVMGFADLLVGLGLPYDDPRALDVAREVMSFIHRASRQASEALAAERGPFPAYAQSRIKARGEAPRRNATTNTIAPTGTLSILAGCSAGIEPLFAPAYHRRLLDGQELDEVHPLFAQRLAAAGLLSDALVRRVAAAGHARVEGVPPDLARLFVTAHEVPAPVHVAMQAAFQAHVDNSVSKTVNLPADATVEDVAAVIRQAHDLGCKGLTVYRDGSREGQVLSTAAQAATPTLEADPPETPAASACPDCGSTPSRAGRIQYCARCAWSA